MSRNKKQTETKSQLAGIFVPYEGDYNEQMSRLEAEGWKLYPIATGFYLFKTALELSYYSREQMSKLTPAQRLGF